MSTSKQMKTEDLPHELLFTINNILKKKIQTPVRFKSTPHGAADYFTYKITIQDGSKTNVIECNEYDIKNDVKSLVNYVIAD